jgi:phosphoribosyl-ATP pyrophosphohydrolase
VREALDAAPDVLAELESVLVGRRDDPPPAGSYSATLVADPERAQRKIMEEAFELCLELGRAAPDVQRTAEEAADLVFHVLAGLVGAQVPLEAVLAELRGRRTGRPAPAHGTGAGR